MTEEEPTLSETVGDGQAANDKVPTENILPDPDEAVRVAEVGGDGGKGEGEDAGDVSENVNAEPEQVELEPSSQADEDVEDALDVSKTTTELSSDLNDINDAEKPTKTDDKSVSCIGIILLLEH